MLVLRSTAELLDRRFVGDVLLPADSVDLYLSPRTCCRYDGATSGWLSHATPLAARAASVFSQFGCSSCCFVGAISSVKLPFRYNCCCSRHTRCDSRCVAASAVVALSVIPVGTSFTMAKFGVASFGFMLGLFHVLLPPELPKEHNLRLFEPLWPCRQQSIFGLITDIDDIGWHTNTSVTCIEPR